MLIEILQKVMPLEYLSCFIKQDCVRFKHTVQKEDDGLFKDPENVEIEKCLKDLGFELIKRTDCSERRVDRFPIVIYSYELQYSKINLLQSDLDFLAEYFDKKNEFFKYPALWKYEIVPLDPNRELIDGEYVMVHPETRKPFKKHKTISV